LKKFPSLIRLPKNNHFDFEPRYYDPVKEDIENRIALIKSEMEEDKNVEYKPNLTGAFTRNRKSNTAATAPGFLQLIIFLVLLGGFVGWIFYGNKILYILAAFIPVYLFLRLRKVL